MKMMVEFTKTLFANGVGLAVWMSLLLLATNSPRLTGIRQ